MASTLSKKSIHLDNVYKDITHYIVAMPSLVSPTFDCQKFKERAAASLESSVAFTWESVCDWVGMCTSTHVLMVIIIE